VTAETEPAVPLLGDAAVAALADISYRWDLPMGARVEIAAWVAALVAEQRKAERSRLTDVVSDAHTACYRDVEEQARKIDPDLEGYSVGELAQNMRLILAGRVEDAEAERDEARAALERVQAWMTANGLGGEASRLLSAPAIANVEG
jgi:hypothetical protein